MPPQPPAPDAAGHLPLPLLRQYVAGALPAAEQHRIEAHTLSCPRCAEILEGLELTDAATTDQALSQLRHRLHQRVAQEATPRRAIRAWQAVAAVLLLLIASTALWWNLRQPAPTPELARVAPPPAAPAPTNAAAATADAATPAGELAATAAETAAVAAAPPAAPEPAPPAVASAPRPARPRVLAQVRTRPAQPAAARRPAPEPASADVAAVVAEAPPTVAYSAPAAGAARSEASPAAQELKEAADTLPAPATTAAVASAPAGKAKRAVAEEGAARKAALPPAAIVTPQPVGGYLALREYLRRENKFEPEHPAIELSGTVRVKFTVTAAGKLENFQIVRGMRRDYDQEAIRLLCEGPAWQPGAANGRRTDQVVEISVSF
ncbi:energy transducer TonB [Hymenobacter aquaticus]|uniref:energy transducer TonB n=1 Tax=Hymenobacter aquaticus TaxID=1867101 RepID=UPI0014369B1C|nr:energy transducer TonB [Hymenobacter aquaticus]